MSILLSGKAVKAVQWEVAAATAAGAASPQVAEVQFFSNGAITASGSPGDQWYSAIATGIGNDYEIYAELISGSGVAGDFDAWLSLSASRSWSLSNASPGFVTATIELSIRKAGESIVMHSGQIVLSAEVTT